MSAVETERLLLRAAECARLADEHEAAGLALAGSMAREDVLLAAAHFTNAAALRGPARFRR